MISSVISRLNDRRDAAADLGEDAGFTLIELMVVLLILAILLAIAIPTFLGVTGGANDRAAQSNLNTALTTVKTQATQLGQTAVAGGTSPVVLVSTAVSAAALAGVVQTPGVSHFFGCTPLGPVGWSIAGGAAVVATGASVIVPWVWRRAWPANGDDEYGVPAAGAGR